MVTDYELLDDDQRGNWIYKASMSDQWVDDMIQTLMSIPTLDEHDPECQAFVVSNSRVTTTGPLSIQRRFKPDNIKEDNWHSLVNEFKDVVINTIRHALNKHESFALNPAKYWTVDGCKNTYHTLHYHLPHDSRDKIAAMMEDTDTHTTTYISAVCYLSVPDLPTSDLERGSGRFVYITINEFGMPKPVEVRPCVGDVLIFPSTLLHGAYPHSKGLRQTFNCDFIEDKNV